MHNIETGTAPSDALPPAATDVFDDKKDAVQSTSSKDDAPTPETKIKPEREPTFKDYLRVFTYATKWDIFAYFAAGIASIAAGTTLPLMNSKETQPCS